MATAKVTFVILSCQIRTLPATAPLSALDHLEANCRVELPSVDGEMDRFELLSVCRSSRSLHFSLMLLTLRLFGDGVLMDAKGRTKKLSKRNARGSCEVQGWGNYEGAAALE
jgi:hypothetical protein